MTPEIVYALINNYRIQEGNIALSVNNNLQASAYERTYLQEWSHDGWVEVVQNHYTYTYAGENLAKGQKDEIQLINEWIQSQAHNDILLSEKACEMGYAYNNGISVLHTGCYGNIEQLYDKIKPCQQDDQLNTMTELSPKLDNTLMNVLHNMIKSLLKKNLPALSE